jgi:hypothetical protein
MEDQIDSKAEQAPIDQNQVSDKAAETKGSPTSE